MTFLKQNLIKSFNFNQLKYVNQIGRCYTTSRKTIPTMIESICFFLVLNF